MPPISDAIDAFAHLQARKTAHVGKPEPITQDSPAFIEYLDGFASDVYWTMDDAWDCFVHDECCKINGKPYLMSECFKDRDGDWHLSQDDADEANWNLMSGRERAYDAACQRADNEWKGGQ